MPPISWRAAAKLNLYLHVLNKRADGYHAIESLVVFTSLADEVTVKAADTLSLTTLGEFADAAGDGEGNLVLKAARALQEHTGCKQGAELTLTKNIPVGAGLGGGSADAAAALRGLNDFWQLGLNAAQLHALAVPLGADVAMCLASAPVIARGIGEQLSPLRHPLPALHALLVHPRTPLLTKAVYGAFTLQPSAPVWEDRAMDTAAFFRALAATRNHLQPAAIAVDPIVAEILLALETLHPAPNLARMTGSGACCFALYETAETAARAAETLRQNYPNWWIKAVEIHA